MQVMQDIGLKKLMDRIHTIRRVDRISTTGHRTQDIGRRKLTDRIGIINQQEQAVRNVEHRHTEFGIVQLPLQTRRHLRPKQEELKRKY